MLIKSINKIRSFFGENFFGIEFHTGISIETTLAWHFMCWRTVCHELFLNILTTSATSLSIRSVWLGVKLCYCVLQDHRFSAAEVPPGSQRTRVQNGNQAESRLVTVYCTLFIDITKNVYIEPALYLEYPKESILAGFFNNMMPFVCNAFRICFWSIWGYQVSFWAFWAQIWLIN